MYSWALIISVGKLKLSRKCSVKPSRISALEQYPDGILFFSSSLGSEATPWSAVRKISVFSNPILFLI